jgi:hypothetical protein
MVAALLRLMTAIALAFMPLGMATAAVPPSAGPWSASSEHCDEQPTPADARSAPKAHCGACAGLPAVLDVLSDSELRPSMRLLVQATSWVTKRGPEIDTRPPKLD